jgi:protein arginine kinase activator
MKCEVCKSKEAVVHFKQIVNGESRELHVCAQCATEHGLDVQSPMSVTDFLFGLGGEREKQPARDAKKCPACGLKARDFRKRTRMGCPACYDTFSEELEPMLTAMHKSRQHVGKVPARQRTTAEIGFLEKALEKAVARQDFEEAAQLRDRIHELKRRRPAGAEGGGERQP